MDIDNADRCNEARFRENAVPAKGRSEQTNPVEAVCNADNVTKDVTLKKEIGLVSGIGLVVGSIIGSGIFLSPNIVLYHAGSVGTSLILWAACGVITIISAVCYLELGTMLPSSGSSYFYLVEAFGRSEKHNFLGPLPGFLYSWIQILISRPAGLAITYMTFAQYAINPLFGDCGAPVLVTKLCAICTVLFTTIVNCYNVNAATKLQNFFMFAKLSALGIIIVGGIVNLAKGHTENLENGFDGTTPSAPNVALGLIGGLYAFAGWASLNMVMDEVRNPSTNLPRALLIAIPLVTTVYVLANISYFTVMSKEELLASPAVAMTWGDAMLGVMAWIMPLSVAFSTFGTACCVAFSSGRLCYAAAKEEQFLHVFSYISVNRLTPSLAIMFFAGLTIVMIIPSDIASLINFLGFVTWLSVAGAMAALITMRWTRPHLDRPIKVPIVIPIINLFISIFLVVVPIIESPEWGYLFAALGILCGILLYIPFVYFKVHFRFADKFTIWCQLFFEIAPPI